MSACSSCNEMADSALPHLQYSAIKQALPQAAKLLGVKEDDLHVLTHYADHLKYLAHLKSIKSKDRVLDTVGLDGIPFIQVSKKQKTSFYIGVGLILYGSREQVPNPNFVPEKVADSFRDKVTIPKHLYVTLSFYVDGSHYLFIFIEKGKLFSFARYTERLSQVDDLQTPPVLKEGLLDTLIKNSIHFLINSKQIEQYGVRIRRGLLLYGPPGNGKTMSCKWIRTLCSKNNLSSSVVQNADILRAFQDNELAGLFGQTDVTFFDDIDLSLFSRKHHGSKTEIACSLLAAMDGINSDHHSITIFATNEEAITIDTAFRRPGRIDVCLAFPKPTFQLREQLVNQWPKEIIDVITPDEIAKRTPDFSFAQLEAVRTALVINYIFGTNTWDLDLALKESSEKNGDLNDFTQPAGFNREAAAELMESPVVVRESQSIV